mmetsp:Transcript_5660/g.21431  ORF Transcript_5660/g.21431 Transcript_5660/m.21431 type:complete len:363 (-) Transcript_5660:520-1608(-)
MCGYNIGISFVLNCSKSTEPTSPNQFSLFSSDFFSRVFFPFPFVDSTPTSVEASSFAVTCFCSALVSSVTVTSPTSAVPESSSNGFSCSELTCVKILASCSPCKLAFFATRANIPASSHSAPISRNAVTTYAISGRSTGLVAHMATSSSANLASHDFGMGNRSFFTTTESMTSCFEMSPCVHGILNSMSSHSTIPRLYTSTLSPEYPTGAVAPSKGGSSISGAIHNMVPTGCHRPEKPSQFFAGRRGILEIGAALPKSQSFARTRFSVGHHVSNTLWLFMSRCAKPALCRYSNASATSMATAGMSSNGASVGVFILMRLLSSSSSPSSPTQCLALISSHFTAFHTLPPSHHSVTMNGAGVLP